MRVHIVKCISIKLKVWDLSFLTLCRCLYLLLCCLSWPINCGGCWCLSFCCGCCCHGWLRYWWKWWCGWQGLRGGNWTGSWTDGQKCWRQRRCAWDRLNNLSLLQRKRLVTAVSGLRTELGLRTKQIWQQRCLHWNKLFIVKWELFDVPHASSNLNKIPITSCELVIYTILMSCLHLIIFHTKP